MILSDGEIEEAIRKKQISIYPRPVDTQYTPSALDLMLGEEIFELKSTAVKIVCSGFRYYGHDPTSIAAIFSGKVASL